MNPKSRAVSLCHPWQNWLNADYLYPTGGFNNVTDRTPFPLGSTYIKLASEHEQANGEFFSMRLIR